MAGERVGAGRQDAHGNKVVTALVVALLAVSVFAPLLGLWLGNWTLPPVALPAGAMIRDLMILALGALALLRLAREGFPRPVAVLTAAWVLYAAWIAFLVLSSPAPLPTAMVARTHLLFPAAGAVLVVLRPWIDMRAAGRWLCAVAVIAAVLGIADSLSQSAVLERIGFNVLDSGYRSEGALVGNTIANVRRATGGIANPIDFGYLMAVLALFGALHAGLAWGALAGDSTDRWLGLACLASCQLAVLLTLARGPLLAMCVCAFAVLGSAVLSGGSPADRAAGSGRHLGALKTLAACAVVLFAVDMIVFVALAPDQGRVVAGRFAPAEAHVDRNGPASQKLSRTALENLPENRRIALETGFSNALKAEQARDGLRAIRDKPMGAGLGTQGAQGATKQQVVSDIFFLWLPLEIGVPGLLLYLVASGAVMFVGRRPVVPRLGFPLFFLLAGTLSVAFVNPILVVPFWGAFVISGDIPAKT